MANASQIIGIVIFATKPFSDPCFITSKEISRRTISHSVVVAFFEVIYSIEINIYVMWPISSCVLVEESSTNTANRKVEVLDQILSRNLNCQQ